MIIVGELINSSRKTIEEAIKAQDVQNLQQVARDQKDHGADFIDVNAGTFVGQESRYMNWLIELVQEAVDAPCCIDSPDPKVVEKALEVHKGTPMVNSISLEQERFDSLLPVISGSQCKVVALCMSDSGMPETADQRLAIADDLVNSLVQKNISPDNIYVDPLVQPVATKDTYGLELLKAIEMIMTRIQGVHTICGLSNISFGLPKRALLNQTLLVMAVTKGLDSVIINPLDNRIMALVKAAETLLGKDSYCMNYLDAYRAKKLDLAK